MNFSYLNLNKFVGCLSVNGLQSSNTENENSSAFFLLSDENSLRSNSTEHFLHVYQLHLGRFCGYIDVARFSFTQFSVNRFPLPNYTKSPFFKLADHVTNRFSRLSKKLLVIFSVKLSRKKSIKIESLPEKTVVHFPL